MSVRFTAPYAAIYAWEQLGHQVPALNTALTAAGPLLVHGPTTDEALVCGFYGVATGTLNYWSLIKAAGSNSTQIRAYTGSGSVVVSSSFDLAPGLWHLSLEYDPVAGQVRARRDGVVVASMAFTPAPGTLGDRSFQVGGYGELPGIIDASVERWRMWTAVLTEAELRAEFRSTVPVRTANLIHNWPMMNWATWAADTVAGQPDLAENPAAPVVESGPIVLRPSIVGTPVFYDLGQTTAPGAQSVTVPAWAEYVGIHITASDNAAAPYGDLSSLVANFIGSFTRANAAVNALAAGGWVATAQVTSSAAGRTFTPTFTEGSPLAGANAWLYFIQDTTGATARGVAQATGTGGTTPGTASAEGAANGLAVAMDMHLGNVSGAYPSNEAGWESPTGRTAQTTGAFGYFSGTRLRTKLITASGTESATTQDTLGSVISLATWAPKPLASPTTYTLAASLAAAVRIARSATVGTAVAVREGKTAGTALAMAVRQARTAQASLDMAVSQARAASMVLNLGVQAAAQTSVGADAVVQRALAAAASVDLAVSRAESVATAVSLQVQTASQASASMDLMVQGGASQSVSVAVLVQEMKQAAQAVALAVQQARSAAFGLSAAVQGGRSAGIGLDLVALMTRTAGAAVDLQVQEGAARAVTLHAAVQFAGQAATALTAAVAGIATANLSIGAAVSLNQALSASMDAAVLAGRTAGTAVALYVDDPTVELVIEEAFIARPAARNWTARNPRWGSS